MKTSMLAFATDLRDEGIATVLDNVQNRAGVDGLTMAVAYHDARDLFPHNPVRKVRYLEGGTVFFPPEATRYEGLQPRVSELARTGDPLGELCEAAGERGMRVNAWAVFLHNDRLGFAHPECATQNAFGDRYLTDLCPSNPDVRKYARTLASDIARYDVSTILSESLHFHGLEHGYHHERYFEELGAVGVYLLGLCFCEHCLEAGRRRGVDAAMVHRSVRDELERHFSGGGGEDPEGLTREDLEPFGGEAASALGWQMGIDHAALADVCDTVAVTGYAADPDRLSLDLDAYQSLVPEASRLGLVLRPMPPDCRSPGNLAAKVALARERGLGRLDFYHYGFCRLEALDWVRQALATI